VSAPNAGAGHRCVILAATESGSHVRADDILPWAPVVPIGVPSYVGLDGIAIFGEDDPRWYFRLMRFPPDVHVPLHSLGTKLVGYVIEGSVTCVLATGEQIRLSKGDCWVDDGLPHGWSTGPDVGAEVAVVVLPPVNNRSEGIAP
jgi:hypothetical protein